MTFENVIKKYERKLALLEELATLGNPLNRDFGFQISEVKAVLGDLSDLEETYNNINSYHDC